MFLFKWRFRCRRRRRRCSLNSLFCIWNKILLFCFPKSWWSISENLLSFEMLLYTTYLMLTATSWPNQWKRYVSTHLHIPRWCSLLNFLFVCHSHPDIALLTFLRWLLVILSQGTEQNHLFLYQDSLARPGADAWVMWMIGPFCQEIIVGSFMGMSGKL